MRKYQLKTLNLISPFLKLQWKEDINLLNKFDNVLQFKKESQDVVLEGSFKDLQEPRENGRNDKRNSSGTTWIPHGFFRKINEFGEIEFFGCFIDGELKGKCWKSVIGGKIRTDL